MPNFSQVAHIPGQLRPKHLPSQKSLIFDLLFFLESLSLWTSCRVNFSRFVQCFGANFVKVCRRKLFFAFFLSFYYSKGKLWSSWRLLGMFFDFLKPFLSIFLQLNCSFVVNSSFENLAVSEACFGEFRWLARKLDASFSSTCDYFDVFDFSFLAGFHFCTSLFFLRAVLWCSRFGAKLTNGSFWNQVCFFRWQGKQGCLYLWFFFLFQVYHLF